MKRNLRIFVLCFLAFVLGSHMVEASYSTWAEDVLLQAKNSGVLMGSGFVDYRETMPRGELASVLVRAYENITGTKISKGKPSYFSDASYEADFLFELGVMNGVGDGKFSPDTPVTREQIAKIIILMQSVYEKTEISLPDFYDTTQLTDFATISDWAKPYVAKAYNDGVITGYEDGSFRPRKTVSREEAITLLVRSLPLDAAGAFSELNSELFWNLERNLQTGELTVSWSRLAPGTEYVLSVTEQRNSRYEGDIPPNGPNVYHYVDQYDHKLYLYPNRTYQFSLSANGKTLEKSVYIPKIHTEVMDEITAGLPQTKEEADAMQTTVTVPVWKMKADGSKYESSVQLTVHSQIADKVELVFLEIFHGEEKFPVKDAGAYSWRGGRSEHNSGTAIDLNYNENYCVYKDGTVIGECWKPYENPYSVTPYGDVVNAFEKYGFTWGGDAWSNPKDYMHFSYLGT